MSRCGHRYENLFYLASVFPLFLEQCCLCALAVMNWRDNLSPLIKTFRARYKHQNRCHITFLFYIPLIYQLDNTNYDGIYKLQETQLTMMIIQQQTEILQICCAVSAVCLYSGYLHWSLMLLPAPATSLIMCWSQSVMLPVAALEVEEEKWLLAEPFFLLL